MFEIQLRVFLVEIEYSTLPHPYSSHSLEIALPEILSIDERNVSREVIVGGV
jgi:hypothetical protein